MITKILDIVKNKRGVKIPQGRVWAGGTSPCILNSGGVPAKRAEVEARAGREFIFPTPLFLPAPPERQNSASGFSSKKVRILSKRYRQFTISAFLRVVASPSLRSGSAFATILNGFLKSKNNFCPLKRKFAVQSTDKMKFYKPIFFSFAFGERQSDNLILTAQII